MSVFRRPAIRFHDILSQTLSDLANAPHSLVSKVICPPLSGPETMIVWTMKGTLNAEQEAQAGRDHRQAA